MVYRLEAVKIVLSIGMCTDMSVPCICKFLSVYMTRTGIFIYAKTCLYNCILYVHDIDLHIHAMYRFYIPIQVQTCLYMVQTWYVQFCQMLSRWSGFQPEMLGRVLEDRRFLVPQRILIGCSTSSCRLDRHLSGPPVTAAWTRMQAAGPENGWSTRRPS